MDDQTKKEILDMIFEMKKQISPMHIINTLNEIKMNLDRIALRIDEEFYNKYYQNSSEEIRKRLSNKSEKTIKYLQEGGKIPLENDQNSTQ
jgi:regulator of replication initiation timing